MKIQWCDGPLDHWTRTTVVEICPRTEMSVRGNKTCYDLTRETGPVNVVVRQAANQSGHETTESQPGQSGDIKAWELQRWSSFSETLDNVMLPVAPLPQIYWITIWISVEVSKKQYLTFVWGEGVSWQMLTFADEVVPSTLADRTIMSTALNIIVRFSFSGDGAF